MIRLIFFIFFFAFLYLVATGQDTSYVRRNISELSGEEYHGRGYVKKGVNKAAHYLASEMEEIGLQCLGKDYYQSLTYPVNTFPGNITVRVDGKLLQTGTDYFIGAACPQVDREYKVVVFDSVTLSDTIRFFAKAGMMRLKDALVVIDFSYLQASDVRWYYVNLMKSNFIQAAGYIEISNGNLAWATRNAQSDFPVLKIKKNAFSAETETVYIRVKPKLIKNYKTENIVGYIPGTSDEYIVIGAHYDHLGMMGKNVFIPGANDNASGTVMVLDLARYYKQHPGKYNMVFILFTGEEAGLMGSEYFTENPLIPLEKTKIMLNFDMVGTGEKGAAIVNGEAEGYEKIAAKFIEINNRNNYLKDIKLRGLSKNSDHYPFHEAGVKAVFFYTMGADTFYHSPGDVVDNLSLQAYIPLFKLVTDFISEYE